MRNEGVLRLIADEAVGEGVGETIKVPLAYQSKLPELELIKENQRSKYGYM